MKQIEKNAEEQALRAEQKDQESQEMLRYLEQLKVEEQKVSWAGTRGLLGSRVMMMMMMMKADFHLLEV